MKYKLALLLSAFIYLSPAIASPPPLGHGPRMPVKEISHDLGITPAQFSQCFDKLQPVPRGRPGPQDQRRANKKLLLECLQKVNSAITSDSLDKVMDRYRPHGRPPMDPPSGMQDGSQPPGRPVTGQPPILKNDPRRPVEAISHDLGISSEQFVECFKHVNPTPGGARPESTERVHANKQALLACLQKANPSITNETLDKVMDRYRPGGRAAQVPMRQ